MLSGSEDRTTNQDAKFTGQLKDDDIVQAESGPTSSSTHANFRQRHSSDTEITRRRKKRTASSANRNARAHRQLSLEPVVNAARVDPFNSWPVAWHRDLDENFRFLVRRFGPETFGYLENDEGFDIFRTQAQLALRDPAAFHSLMIISTIRKDQLSGQTLPGMNVLWHRVEALKQVKGRIDGGDMVQCTSEGTIYAVMVLMGIGSLWNAVDPNEFHKSALNRLILYKGGLNMLSRSNPVLEMSLFGMAILSPGLLRSDLYAVNELSALDQHQDSRTLLYSLMGFLRGVSGCPEKIPVTLSRVQSIFSPGTPANSLLSFTPNHPGILDNHQHRLQQRLRQHIVLYVFSVLLWASPFQIEHFFNHLHYILGHANIWRNSLRMLAWALVANVQEGSLLLPAQAWQSYEMLCAVHSLDEELQNDVLGYFLELLTGRNAVVRDAGELMSKIRAVMFRPPSEGDS